MRLIFFVIIFFSYCSSLKSQTIATFECNIPGLKNQTGKGLVYISKYRSGFLRLTWYDSIRKENVITDFDLLSAYSRETTATGFQHNLAETDSILFCRAIPSKTIQGKRKFPAKDFHIWFHKGIDSGDYFKIYTGKIPDYGKPDFYKEFYDWGVAFPEPIGFKESVGFISGNILSVNDLIPSVLKNTFLDQN